MKQRPRSDELFIIVLLFLIYLFLVITGLRGIDFGYHWDEKFQFMLVKQTLDTQVLLPAWYQYPSVSYWLSLAATLPHLLGAIQKVGGDWHAIVDHLKLVIDTRAYHLQLRALFLILSALAVFWVFLQSIMLKRSWWESLVAAGFLGFSWEVAYHARWIAPDTVLMQFAALTVLFCLAGVRDLIPDPADPSGPAIQSKNRHWIGAAAVAAGLACGTKYPGGLLLIPVLIAAYHRQDRAGFLRKLLLALLNVIPLFLITYLFTTPGTLLDPIRFAKDLSYEFGHYQVGLYDQTVSPGLAHLGLILTYLSLVAFSHYIPVAFAIFLLALIGVYALFRQSWKLGFLFICFPVVYILYFCLQHVMAARNLLVVFPFLAVLAARGAALIWNRLIGYRYLRWGGIGLLAVLGVMNAYWLVAAAGSISARSTDIFVRQFADYVVAHPGTQIAVSDKLWKQFSSLSEYQKANMPANMVRLPDGKASMIAFYASEGMKNPQDWPSNHPGLATRLFGPWEVNFDYYPLWAGDDRILLMPMEKARRIGIQLVQPE